MLELYDCEVIEEEIFALFAYRVNMGQILLIYPIKSFFVIRN